jgi:acetyl esterase/lipase
MSGPPISENQFEVILQTDLIYSHAGGKPRLADLYLPKVEGYRLPVIVWLHGGGWRFGDRRLAPDLKQFARRGFAMVSFDYRLSDEAIFPAAVEDAKTVVRWIRSIALEFGLNESSIGYWGSSAGAHLAACAALSSDREFATDEHCGFSSSVQAVLDGYGPTDFTKIDYDRTHTMASSGDLEGVSVPDLLPAGHPESFESRFLGEPVSPLSEAAARANPIRYVGPEAPPFLILHGLRDSLIPWQQSQMLFDALSKSGSPATLVLVERLGHGFFNRGDLDSLDAGQCRMFHSSHAESMQFAREARERPFGFSMVESFFRQHLGAASGSR